MESAALGEQWVQSQLALARPAFERGDDALAYSSIAEYEANLRAQVAAFLAPVVEYIGKTVTEARELAEAKVEHLCVHPTAHRACLSPRRVHVRINAGVVVEARRDAPGWLEKDEPPHQW